MNLAAWIGLRYYRARSAGGFVSLVSVVSFLGLVLGIIAMLVVVSVMNGFDRELKERILGAVPHIIVKDVTSGGLPESLVQNYGVISQAPFREENVLLVARTGSHLLRVHGIDPDDITGTAYITEYMQQGALALSLIHI